MRLTFPGVVDTILISSADNELTVLRDKGDKIQAGGSAALQQIIPYFYVHYLTIQLLLCRVSGLDRFTRTLSCF